MSLRGSLALAAFACLGWAQPKPGILEGTIVNSATHAPIPGAKIGMAGQEFSRVTVSNENGKFRIENLEPGTYHVEFVEAPGYVYDTRRNRQFVVLEDQRVSGVSLELLPLGTISGRVLGNDGEPLAYVQVALMQYRYGFGTKALATVDGAITDDRGVYRLFQIRPGRYFVNAWLPPGQIKHGVLQKDWLPATTHRATPESGYLPVFYPNGPDATQASSIVLPPGGEITGIDFRLRGVPVYHIRGKLEGSDKAGRDTSILARACPAPEGAAEYGAPLQAGGRFDIPGVAPGVYCLTLSQAGFSRTLYLSETATVADRDLDLSLRPMTAFPVPGAVRFEGLTGEAPDGVVFLAPASSPGASANRGEIGEAGKFVLEGSVPGTYHVRVNRLPANFYLKSVRYGEQDAPDAIVTLRPGGGGMTVVVGGDGAQLTGTVQLENGDPYGAIVSVTPSGGLAGRDDLFRSVEAGAGGRFKIEGLAPGDYSVLAWDYPAPDDVFMPEVRDQFSAHAVAVTLAPGGSGDIQLKAVTNAEVAKLKGGN